MTAETVAGSQGDDQMADDQPHRLHVDGERPAVALVAALPPSWTDEQERLVLLTMACDSYDGQTCKPGADAVAAWCGLSRATIYRILDRLAAPVPGVRPALIERAQESRGRRRTVYRILPPTVSPTVSEPSQSRLTSVRHNEAPTVSEPSQRGESLHSSLIPLHPHQEGERAFVAHLLEVDDDDERLDMIDALLADKDIRKSRRGYLTKMHVRGDLGPALADLLEQARTDAAKRAEVEARKCPHGTVNGRRPGQCPACDADREAVTT